MAYQRTFGDEHLQVLDQPACMHYRSKAMYVTGKLDPTHLDERESHDEYCWCNMTQHVMGPDEKSVRRCDCIEGRDCFCSR